MIKIFQHLEECTPIKPCACCEIVFFLQKNLSPDHFREFSSLVEKLEGPRPTRPLNTPLDEFEFGPRTANCFKNENILTVGDLIEKTESDLLRIPHFGRRSLNDIKELLKLIGYKLKEQ